jgi:opacity protein-like surface antigen
MRAVILIGTALLMVAGPLSAEERAYVNVGGGVAIAPDVTSGDIRGEAGVRVAPRLFVFGDVGRFANLQPSLAQPAVDLAETLVEASGASVTGVPRVPAWYSAGGVRYELTPTHGVLPYVLGSAGFARLMPGAQFTYGSGVIGDATPAPGADVTPQLVTLGDFTRPAASTAFMFTAGAGVEVPVAPHVRVDVGYRLSHVDADTALTAHSIVAGIGYRF